MEDGSQHNHKRQKGAVGLTVPALTFAISGSTQRDGDPVRTNTEYFILFLDCDKPILDPRMMIEVEKGRPSEVMVRFLQYRLNDSRFRSSCFNDVLSNNLITVVSEKVC